MKGIYSGCISKDTLQGPVECELAVCKLFESLKKEYPDIKEISSHPSRFSNCFTSIMFESEENLSELEGTVQWICESPFPAQLISEKIGLLQESP